MDRRTTIARRRQGAGIVALFPIVVFQLADGQGKHSLMAENGVVRLSKLGLDDIRQEVTDPGTRQSVSEIDIGSTGEKILQFCAGS